MSFIKHKRTLMKHQPYHQAMGTKVLKSEDMRRNTCLMIVSAR